MPHGYPNNRDVCGYRAVRFSFESTLGAIRVAANSVPTLGPHPDLIVRQSDRPDRSQPEAPV
jgi:hypothetical protein